MVGVGGAGSHSPGGPGIGVFLSAVSTEFASARSLIRGDLSAKNWEVKEQTEFVQGDDATTLERLHTYIEGCSTVVCIIGKRAGAMPPLKSALPYLAEYMEILPDDFMPSFTQWELIFAHRLQKRLLIFHAADGYVPDHTDAVADDDPELQARFVGWIFDDLGLNRGNFTTNDELARLVLREDWTTPAANGVKVRAEMSRNGLQGDEESLRVRLRASHDRLAPSLSSDTYELRGRQRERTLLEAYLTRAKEQIVEIVGPQGVGKKKLLSQFESADAVVTAMSQDLDRVEDLVQSAWESLVDPPAGTVLPTQRERELMETEALVFAADVDSGDQLRILLDAMPKARLCVTATKPVTPEARRLELGYLGEDEHQAMLEIFTDRYLLPVPSELEGDIIEICRSVRGNPSCIVQLALDAERATSLEAWVAERKPLTTGSLPADMVLDAAGRAPAAVAAAVDEVVSRDVMVPSTSLEATDRAEPGCAIMRGSPRYRFNSSAPGAGKRPTGEDDELLSEVLGNTVDWAAMAGLTEIFDNRSFVVRMMRWGTEHGYFEEVLEIGRHCEPAMALRGRHGAWQEVLDCSLVAARKLHDGAAEGWALHEMGSRSLLRDDVPQARTQLADALECRLVHDPAAADVTRHNLRLVPGAVISLVGVLVAVVLSLTWVAAVAEADDMYDPDAATARATAKISPEVGLFEIGDEKPFKIENVGDLPFSVEAERLELPDGFDLAENTCTAELAPPAEEQPPADDRTCTLRISFDGVETGQPSGPIAVLVEVPMSVAVDGDGRILLVADATPSS